MTMRAWIGTGQRACVCAWVCARHTIIRHLVVVCAQRHAGVVWSQIKKRVEFPVRSSAIPRASLGRFSALFGPVYQPDSRSRKKK
jgi:hypothetical protein